MSVLMVSALFGAGGIQAAVAELEELLELELELLALEPLELLELELELELLELLELELLELLLAVIDIPSMRG